MDSSKDIAAVSEKAHRPAVPNTNTGTATHNDNASPLPDATLHKLSLTMTNIEEVIDSAKAATEAEHNMGVLEAIRLYPKAVFYSIGLSLALVMEGYDTALLGSFYALDQFNLKFGQLVDADTGLHQLTPSWQSGLQNGTQVGQIIGLLLAGIIADRYGYRKTLIGALIMMIGVIFLFFFCQNIGMLFAAEVIAGLPWGAFQTLTTTYAADVSPIALRPILTTWVNACWVIGQLIAIGVLRGCLTRADEWAYKIPWGVQWVWPVPILIIAFMAPESPNWLVKHGRIDQARQSLRKLTSNKFSDDILEQKITMIRHTNELELQMEEGTSYWHCFKGTNLRRTEIACVVWVSQVFCGIWFGGNVTYFLRIAGGLSETQSFDFGVGTNALAVLATIGAWFMCQRFGRRTLYLSGLSIMFCVLFTVGCLGIPKLSPAIGYTSGALMMCFVVAYDLTVGPICYCLVAEIPSTRLRVKTVVLARIAYNIASLCANFLNPPILNPLGWNLRGKGGFIWGGFCLSVLIWSFFRLPEPRGLSSSEIDVLFEHKTSARKFKKSDADPFSGEHARVGAELATEQKTGMV